MNGKSFQITEAAKAMRELRKLPSQSRAGMPDVLPLDAITIHDAVFQPRTMSEHQARRRAGGTWFGRMEGAAG